MNNAVMNENKELPVICGVEITTDEYGRFNLNALHKASGLGADKAPNQWMRRSSAKSLINELAVNLQLGHEVIESKHGGDNNGTFAHELLAIEYAGWISPAFRLQVNQTFLDYRTGKLQKVQEPQQKLPMNYLEALEALVVAEKEKAIMKPKADVFDQIVEKKTLMNATQVANKLGHSAVKLNKVLMSLDVYNTNVKRGKCFKQWFIDKGYGEMKQTPEGFSQTLFTTAGEAWITQQYQKMNLFSL